MNISLSDPGPSLRRPQRLGTRRKRRRGEETEDGGSKECGKRIIKMEDREGGRVEEEDDVRREGSEGEVGVSEFGGKGERGERRNTRKNTRR
jgi:hypothetical protein